MKKNSKSKSFCGVCSHYGLVKNEGGIDRKYVDNCDKVIGFKNTYEGFVPEAIGSNFGKWNSKNECPYFKRSWINSLVSWLTFQWIKLFK